jgi:molecular chaperone DnaJ
MIASPCKSCRGEGRQRGEHTIPINIPAGVSTGQYMHLRGVGNAGARGGPRGDLVVLFEVDDDERFERDGEDLYTEVLLTFPQVVRGADVEVAGIAGAITLHIPPGTQSGQVFQLRGRGLPRVNASGTGDLHVRVQLWTPTDLTADEKRVIEELAKVHSPVPVNRSKGFWAKMKEALGA